MFSNDSERNMFMLYQLKKRQFFFGFFFGFFFKLAESCGFEDVSLPAREQTQNLHSDSAKPQPLYCQGIPKTDILLHLTKLST